MISEYGPAIFVQYPYLQNGDEVKWLLHSEPLNVIQAKMNGR